MCVKNILVKLPGCVVAVRDGLSLGHRAWVRWSFPLMMRLIVFVFRTLEWNGYLGCGAVWCAGACGFDYYGVGG